MDYLKNASLLSFLLLFFNLPKWVSMKVILLFSAHQRKKNSKVLLFQTIRFLSFAALTPDTSHLFISIFFLSFFFSPFLSELAFFLLLICFQVFVAIFLFWRLAYNVGLGFLLHHQSKSKFLTACVKYITPDNPLYNVICKFVCLGMDKNYKYEEMPACFNAWIGFRHIVDIVLANDLITYPKELVAFLFSF